MIGLRHRAHIGQMERVDRPFALVRERDALSRRFSLDSGPARAEYAGNYQVMVGSSSSDIVGQGTVALPSETP